MEGNFQGDLADVVRASGSGSGAVVGDVGRVDDFPVDQLPLTPPLNACEGFGDPFSSMRDPLVVELEGIGHGFHGDHFSIGDERSPAASAFRVSCSSDSKSIDCDLRGGFTACGVMNPSSPKGLSSLVDTTRAQISSPRNPILKRRKSQAKKVVCIPAPTAVNSRQGGGEVVPSDLWAWRKYGQKPIKGSPYPRGYYRCSSSKGCSARKQVERSRTDPNMLVITYTSEHNHPWPTQRNSLAGSSRIPAATSPSPTVEAAHPPSKPPPLLEPDQRGVTLPSQPMMSQLVFDYDNDNNNENEKEKEKSYRPVLQEEGSEHDFFADLRELEEAEALSLLGGNKSLLDDVDDPFGSLFDWSTSNSSTTANSDPRQNSH